MPGSLLEWRLFAQKYKKILGSGALYQGSSYYQVECGGVLLSHTLSSAVPSPRPGLSFRVRKGTGRLTWAMTTAKPIQRPTPTGRPAEPEPRHDSDRGGPGTGQRTRTKRFDLSSRDHKKQHSLPSNEKPPQDETQPTTKERVGKCAAFAR